MDFQQFYQRILIYLLCYKTLYFLYIHFLSPKLNSMKNTNNLFSNLKAKGVDVIFVGLLKQPRYMMERIDIIPDFIPEWKIF